MDNNSNELFYRETARDQRILHVAEIDRKQKQKKRKKKKKK